MQGMSDKTARVNPVADFARYLDKYIAMIIIALDQKYCRAGLLQIGK